MIESKPQVLTEYYRQCPGEAYKISDAVCYQRQKHHYPKCPGCQWNPATKMIVEAAKGGAGGGKEHSPLYEVPMIEKVYKAYDIRGVYPDPLNEDIAWNTGWAMTGALIAPNTPPAMPATRSAADGVEGTHRSSGSHTAAAAARIDRSRDGRGVACVPVARLLGAIAPPAIPPAWGAGYRGRTWQPWRMATYVEQDLAWADRAPLVVESTAAVAGTPQEVWDAILDYPRWAEWFPRIARCRSTSDPAYGLGSTRDVTLKGGGGTVSERFIAWDEPEVWAFATGKPKRDSTHIDLLLDSLAGAATVRDQSTYATFNALLDAIIATADYAQEKAKRRRKALVIISDGLEKNSSVKEKEVMEAITLSLEHSKLTDGAFDITFNAFFGKYSWKPGHERFPTDAEIKRLLPLVNYKNVIVDKNGPRFVGRVPEDVVLPMEEEGVPLPGGERRHRDRHRIPLMFEEGPEVVLDDITQHRGPSSWPSGTRRTPVQDHANRRRAALIEHSVDEKSIAVWRRFDDGTR